MFHQPHTRSLKHWHSLGSSWSWSNGSWIYNYLCYQLDWQLPMLSVPITT